MAHAVHALDKAGQEAKKGGKKKPSPPPSTEHQVVEAPDFSSMKVADLLLYASKNNIEIPDDAKKQDIIEILEKS